MRQVPILLSLDSIGDADVLLGQMPCLLRHLCTVQTLINEIKVTLKKGTCRSEIRWPRVSWRPGLPRTNILALAVVVGTLCFHEFLRESSSVQCATVKVEHSLEESQQRSYSYSIEFRISVIIFFIIWCPIFVGPALYHISLKYLKYPFTINSNMRCELSKGEIQNWNFQFSKHFIF